MVTGEIGGEDNLAPVIPLFGRRQPDHDEPFHAAGENHPAHRGLRKMATPVLAGEQASTSNTEIDSGLETDVAAGPDPDRTREVGAEALVRKLRARSLSVSESRQVLRGHDLTTAQIDDVIDDFCRRGYLDDGVLAEQLVLSGVERKGQGRVALARALSQRGIPRDVIASAMGDLPDDDEERALQFAHTKARSLSRLDFDTALRRLVGQLARRGYGGAVAMNAARTALTEASLGQSPSGVRFVDSD